MIATGVHCKFLSPQAAMRCYVAGTELEISIDALPLAEKVRSLHVSLKKSCKRLLDAAEVAHADLKLLLSPQKYAEALVRRRCTFKWRLPSSLEITTYYLEMWATVQSGGGVAHSAQRSASHRLFASPKFCISSCIFEILHEDIAACNPPEFPAGWPIAEDVQARITFPHRIVIDSYWRTSLQIKISAVPQQSTPFYYRPLIEYCFVAGVWVNGSTVEHTLTLSINAVQKIYLSPRFRWSIKTKFEGKWYEIASVGEFTPVVTVLGLLNSQTLRLFRNKLPIASVE